MVHIVFIAAPGFGHVLPLAHLAHFTAVSGATATFLASNVPIHHLERVGELDAIKHENLRILALPTDGTVTWDDMSAGPQAIMKLYHQMLEPCRAILHALAGKPSENTNDSLLVDFSTKTPLIKDVAPAMAIVGSPFIFFGPEIARSLSMRWTTFIDTSIIGSIVTLRMAEAAASDKLGSIAKDGIDIPGVFHLSDKELINIWLANGFSQLVAESDDLLLNTTSSLDEKIFPVVSSTKPSFAIGPVASRVPPLDKSTFTSPIIEYLDAQKAGSVIYIAMGSGATLPDDEVFALQQALLHSDTPFVWSNKTHAGVDGIKREGNGIYVTWGPQREALKHGSIGLFITHGGWNSVVEGLTSGVPMLVRPFHAEQTLNARLVAEVYSVGRRFDITTLEQDLEDLKCGGWEVAQRKAQVIKSDIHATLGETGSSSDAWKAWLGGLSG